MSVHYGKVNADPYTMAEDRMTGRFPVSSRSTVRAYGTTLLRPGHFLLDGIGADFAAHGDRVWRSSYLAMDWLSDNPPLRGGRVLELGCGWAPLSAFCVRRFGMSATGLDIDPAVAEAADMQARVNGVELDFLEGSWADLDWDDLQDTDLVVGADICYWESQAAALADVVRKAASFDASIVLADPGRPSFDRLVRDVEDSDRFMAEVVDRSSGKPVPMDGKLVVRAGRCRHWERGHDPGPEGD